MTTSDHQVFTAQDGNRYRTTGEFRKAVTGEYFVYGDPRKGSVVMHVASDTEQTPNHHIIVEPAELTYEVTVTLNQEQFDHLSATDAAQQSPRLGTYLGSNLIAAEILDGKFREITQ